MLASITEENAKIEDAIKSHDRMTALVGLIAAGRSNDPGRLLNLASRSSDNELAELAKIQLKFLDIRRKQSKHH